MSRLRRARRLRLRDVRFETLEERTLLAGFEPPNVLSVDRLDSNPTAAAAVDFLVTFDEDVTGVDVTDFSLAVTGGVAGADMTTVAGSGATYTVTVKTGSGDGSIRLDVIDDNSIRDLSGDKLGGGWPQQRELHCRRGLHGRQNGSRG